MRIALLHGWSLSGSGSNEYTRYLARALAAAGHEIHVLCRESEPERFDLGKRVLVHQLPHGPLRPVYVTDKQRVGVVRPFTALTNQEIQEYLGIYVAAVQDVLSRHPVDIIHANHLVLQPTVAATVGAALGIPFVIYPHGSAIEYTVRPDARFQQYARDAITDTSGLIIGSHEVQQRLIDMFPELSSHITQRSQIVGVGVDTALFEPVARGERQKAIARLQTMGPRGGKAPALLAQLHARLADGDIDAVTDFQTAYARTLPDEDIVDRLGRLPWSDGKILLFVGALTVGKGLHRLIMAMPRLLAQVPDAHLIIVGSGAYREVLEALLYALAHQERPLLEQLVDRGYELGASHLKGPWSSVRAALQDADFAEQALAIGPRLLDHVHFTGRLSHRYLCHLFPCSDVAVFPSIIPEAYPLVLMESLANGVLPAASNFSGFAEGLDALVDDLGADMVALLRLPTAPEQAVISMA
jgi:glycosyltransferase involved in cell wall biosynthesis